MHLTLSPFIPGGAQTGSASCRDEAVCCEMPAIHLHLGPPLRPPSHSNLLEISKLLLLRLPSPAITGNQSTGIQQLVGLPNLEDQLLISSNCATIGGQPQQAGQVGGWH